MRHELTDEQWEAIEDIFPEPAPTGRPPDQSVWQFGQRRSNSDSTSAVSVNVYLN